MFCTEVFATRSLNSNLANKSEAINSLNNAVSARYTENGRINLYVGSDGKLHFVNRDGADTALNFSSGYKGLFKQVYSYYHESSSADDSRIRVTNVDTGAYIAVKSSSTATVSFEDLSLRYDGSAFSVKPLDSSKYMIKQESPSSSVSIGNIYDSWMNHTSTRFAIVDSTGFLYDRA